MLIIYSNMLLTKRKEHAHLSAQKELEFLRDENSKLKDSLVLQTSALARERKQKEVYIRKSQRLEKERAKAVKSCQQLLVILMKNNIGVDDEPVAKICDFDVPEKIVQAKDSKALESKSTACGSSKLGQIAPRTGLVNKLLQGHTQALQGQQSGSLLKRTSLQIKGQQSKLFTLRQVKGGSCESRGSILSAGKNSASSQSRSKLSYIEKIQSRQI